MLVASLKNFVKSKGTTQARAECEIFAKPLLGTVHMPRACGSSARYRANRAAVLGGGGGVCLPVCLVPATVHALMAYSAADPSFNGTPPVFKRDVGEYVKPLQASALGGTPPRLLCWSWSCRLAAGLTACRTLLSLLSSGLVDDALCGGH